MGDGAFSDCAALTRAVFLYEKPEGTAGEAASAFELGANVFSGCVQLSDVQLPASLESLPDGLFSGCVQLADVSIPEGVTKLGEACFLNCESLRLRALPEGLKSLGARAFAGCRAMGEPDRAGRRGARFRTRRFPAASRCGRFR